MSSARPDAALENRAPELLARIIGSGRDFTIEIRGSGGTPVRSGAKIIDGYAYEWVLPADGLRAEQRETIVCLVAEDEGEPDVRAALARLDNAAKSLK